MLPILDILAMVTLNKFLETVVLVSEDYMFVFTFHKWINKTEMAVKLR